MRKLPGKPSKTAGSSRVTWAIFKSLLIADDGEKYSPEGIEEAFTEYVPFVEQCMMYNNQDPYCIVLVVPAEEALNHWLKENNIEKGTDEAKTGVLRELESQVAEFRTGGAYAEVFPQRWLPAAIGILPEPFSVENHQLNSLNKLVRGKVTEAYAERMKFMYTPEAKNILNDQNLQSLGDL
jgi:long-chain acyl-CoA synthetase